MIITYNGHEYSKPYITECCNNATYPSAMEVVVEGYETLMRDSERWDREFLHVIDVGAKNDSLTLMERTELIYLQAAQIAEAERAFYVTVTFLPLAEEEYKPLAEIMLAAFMEPLDCNSLVGQVIFACRNFDQVQSIKEAFRLYQNMEVHGI